MKTKIGIVLKNTRKKMKITKTKLSTLAKVGVKTIRRLEQGKNVSIETIVKIRNVLKENYKLDLYEISGVKYVWDIEDFSKETLEIVEGNLLGDGCVAGEGVYTQTAKDRRYLEWLSEFLSKGGLCCKIISTRSKTSFSSSHAYYLYSHKCPAFLKLKNKWYKRENGKLVKIAPKDLEITPTVLLHWYLGDGNFHRDTRKEKYKRGRASVRLCTNGFLKEDIKLLIQKLKKVGLNFYTTPKLNKEREKGYILCLYVNDTYNFFRLIGLHPIKKIKNCITKIYKNRKCTFEGKWPKKEDWVKILAKTEGIGNVLKEKRKKLNMTQKQLAEKVGVKKHQICEIECGRRYTHLKRFEKFLEILKLDVYDVLRRLSRFK